MRMWLKKFAFGGTVALALTLALPASPAFAINNAPCGDQNAGNLLKLQSAAVGDTCFANAGVTAVNIPGVYRITSGSYKVTVNYGAQTRVYEVRIW